MQAQLSLGLGETPPTERLFFAVMPDPGAIDAIGRQLDALRRSASLTAKPLPQQRWHVTLHHLGDFAGIAPSLLERAREVAGQVDAAAFDVSFNQVGSFGGRARQHPLVLRGDDANAPLRALQHRLGLGLARAGLGQGDSFVPHLTLMYDRLRLQDRPVAPLGWRVHEFVLIRSFLGRTRYQFEGRWPLR